MVIHIITPSVDYNQWLQRLDTQLDKPNNQNSILVPKVVKLKSISSKAQKNHEWTNRQSEWYRRCSVDEYANNHISINQNNKKYFFVWWTEEPKNYALDAHWYKESFPINLPPNRLWLDTTTDTDQIFL